MRGGVGLQIEHVRHVQGRGAGAGVGVAAHDAAVSGGANDRQLDVVGGLVAAGAGGLHSRLLRAEPRLGRGDGVAGLVQALGGDEVGRDQLLQAVVLALSRGDVDVDQAQLALGFRQIGGGGLQRQARLVVFLAGQDLASGHAVAFLHQDFAHHAAAARGDLDDAALDVDLAVGDGGIGAFDLFLGLGGGFRLLGGTGGADDGEADEQHDQQREADPEPFVFQESGHVRRPQRIGVSARPERRRDWGCGADRR